MAIGASRSTRESAFGTLRQRWLGGWHRQRRPRHPATAAAKEEGADQQSRMRRAYGVGNGYRYTALPTTRAGAPFLPSSRVVPFPFNLYCRGRSGMHLTSAPLCCGPARPGQVLELGAGATGLPGLTAWVLGARAVVLTDYIPEVCRPASDGDG
eukprot:COSAG01_NODE_161_length_23642_cov_713.337000_12_plen_154_part_00